MCRDIAETAKVKIVREKMRLNGALVSAKPPPSRGGGDPRDGSHCVELSLTH